MSLPIPVSTPKLPQIPTPTTTPPAQGLGFELRPYPPPALANVPTAYIVDRLHKLAPYYWTRPETADCTIVVPIPQLQGLPVPPSLCSLFPLQAATVDLTTPGRKSQPVANFVPQLSFHLHIDYLSAQSAFLRGLFSGADPRDLIHRTRPVPSVPSNRLPYLLSSQPAHPVLFLPVPDPLSLPLILHWIYFGSNTVLSRSLLHNVVHWEGLARNVSYLRLSSGIKRFLRQWYTRWVIYPERVSDTCSCSCDSDSDSDVVTGEGTPGNDLSDVSWSRSSVVSKSTMDDGDSDTQTWQSRGRPRCRIRSFQNHNTENMGLLQNS